METTTVTRFGRTVLRTLLVCLLAPAAVAFAQEPTPAPAPRPMFTLPKENRYGQLVRWQLVEVLDVYELFDDEISPKGTEVFSRLRSRRMKPAYAWRSRGKGA
jgi:hypothetical protein